MVGHESVRRLTRWGSIGLAAVLLVGVGWIAYYRISYHTFVWWRPPPSIRYCGRDYSEGKTLSTFPNGDWKFVKATTIWPGRWQVFEQLPTKQATQPTATGASCAIALVLKEGDHSFIQYLLGGSP